MTDEEILKALDEAGKPDSPLPPHPIAWEAAALIRRLQSKLERVEGLLVARIAGVELTEETMRDRDARAAMHGLIDSTGSIGESTADLAFKMADAMAAERARRNGGGK